jgi:hypothetical protein
MLRVEMLLDFSDVIEENLPLKVIDHQLRDLLPLLVMEYF